MADAGAVGTFVKTLHNDTYSFISPSTADLSGRHVPITGASKGLARAMAISSTAAGASAIVLLARSGLGETKDLVHAAAEKAGRAEPKVLTVKCDTMSELDVDAAAKRVAEGLGTLDVVVNNAGYLETWTPIAESEPGEWWKSWEVNVKGTYLVSRAFIPLLLKSPGGLKTIVSVTSMGGIRLTNFLCADHKEQGLLAYTLHPGGVKTEMAHGMPEYMHPLLGDTPELAGDWLTKERREWLMDRFVSVQWDMEELEAKEIQIEKRDLLNFKMAL